MCSSPCTENKEIIFFQENILYIFLGIALALLMVPGFAQLGQHFDKYYPLAGGVSQGCCALGIIVFPPFTQVLSDTYGWRNTLLLLGGIYLHMIIGGILLRSPSRMQTFAFLWSNDIDYDNDPCLETNDSEHDTFTWMDLPSAGSGRDAKCTNDYMHNTGLHLFKNVSFIANCVAFGSVLGTFVGWVIYFVPHCLTKGLTLHEASLLASIAGFASLLGPFVYIPLVSKRLISVRGYIYISCALVSISLFADPFSSTFATVLLSSSCFAFGCSANYPLLDICLKSVVDEVDLSKAFGWRVAVGGVFRILSGFLVGKLSCREIDKGPCKLEHL